MEANEWVASEISHGRMRVTNGDFSVSVFADFSGHIIGPGGSFMEFKDLRDLIGGAKLLETALIEHYGGWK